MGMTREALLQQEADDMLKRAARGRSAEATWVPKSAPVDIRSLAVQAILAERNRDRSATEILSALEVVFGPDITMLLQGVKK